MEMGRWDGKREQERREAGAYSRDHSVLPPRPAAPQGGPHHYAYLLI